MSYGNAIVNNFGPNFSYNIELREIAIIGLI